MRTAPELSVFAAIYTRVYILCPLPSQILLAEYRRPKAGRAYFTPKKCLCTADWHQMFEWRITVT